VANSFYVDASSLAKRYVPEKGSAQVHTLLDTLPGNRLYLLNVGVGEIVSILVRKRMAESSRAQTSDKRWSKLKARSSTAPT
jgi:predicted nucleic acid-binding protein